MNGIKTADSPYVLSASAVTKIVSFRLLRLLRLLRFPIPLRLPTLLILGTQTWADGNNPPTTTGRGGGDGKLERGNGGGEERVGDRITVIYIEKPGSRHDPFGSVCGWINQSIHHHHHSTARRAKYVAYSKCAGQGAGRAS